MSAPPGLDARTDEGAADPAGEPSAVDRTRAAGRETLAAVKEHRTPLLAAGVAFYFFLALVPTLAVAVAIYGFFANPADVRRLVHDALGAAPHEVRNLVTSQLESVSRDSGGGNGLTAALGALFALWSASSGTGHLLDAVTTAFRDVDRRSFVRKKLVAIVLTLCTFAFGAVSIGVIAFVPSVLASLGAPGPIRWLVGVLRWPLLAGGMLSALAVLYRIARPETRPRPRLVTVGAVVAAVVWIAGSLLFSLYAANFGRYQATYGSLASIVVLLLWLLLSAFVIILGAEIDAAAARTTRGD